ncbi:MAG: SemiSWEET family sugar transporter [Cyclobacteriaceae bacterium]
MEAMDWIQLAGHTGALLSSLTFVPQAYKTWVTKSVGDLSFAMLVIVFTSTIVWLIYGIYLMLWPVILANSFINIVSMVLIYFKFAFKKKYLV